MIRRVFELDGSEIKEAIAQYIALRTGSAEGIRAEGVTLHAGDDEFTCDTLAVRARCVAGMPDKPRGGDEQMGR